MISHQSVVLIREALSVLPVVLNAVGQIMRSPILDSPDEVEIEGLIKNWLVLEGEIEKWKETKSIDDFPGWIARLENMDNSIRELDRHTHTLGVNLRNVKEILQMITTFHSATKEELDSLSR